MDARGNAFITGKTVDGLPLFRAPQPAYYGPQCQRYSNFGSLLGYIECGDAFVAGFNLVRRGPLVFNLLERVLFRFRQRHSRRCGRESIRRRQRVVDLARNKAVFQWRECVRCQIDHRGNCSWFREVATSPQVMPFWLKDRLPQNRRTCPPPPPGSVVIQKMFSTPLRPPCNGYQSKGAPLARARHTGVQSADGCGSAIRRGRNGSFPARIGLR